MQLRLLDAESVLFVWALDLVVLKESASLAENLAVQLELELMVSSR